MKISVLSIVPNTVVDGPGLRTSVYLAGCNHRCKGCHNPESWNIENGTWKEVEDLADEILSYENYRITFSGGDPFYQPEAFLELLKTLNRKNPYCLSGSWTYTGYTWEELLQNPLFVEILDYLDVVVEGRFVEELRDTSLLFRGSSNQRILRVWHEEYNKHLGIAGISKEQRGIPWESQN